MSNACGGKVGVRRDERRTPMAPGVVGAWGWSWEQLLNNPYKNEKSKIEKISYSLFSSNKKITNKIDPKKPANKIDLKPEKTNKIDLIPKYNYQALPFRFELPKISQK